MIAVESNPTAPRLWNTRLAVLVAALAVFLATLMLYAPSSWAFACVVLLTDGAIAAGWLLGAVALGWLILPASRVRAGGLLQIATAGGLGLGVFGLVGLGLGLAGKLNHGVALALPVGSLSVWALSRARVFTSLNAGQVRASVLRWLLTRADSEWLWLIPVVSLATAALAACVMPGDLWKPLDPHPYDVVSYHLQVPREWYEGGRIVPLWHNVFSYFPFNVEMQFLLLMHACGGAWAGMYACQLLNVGYASLMVLAVAGSVSGGLAEGKNGPGAVIAAAVVSCVPWVIMLASVAYVESALILYTALALIWVVRALMPGTEPDTEKSFYVEMALGGVFGGLAAGVKITALPMLVAAVPVAMLGVDRRRPTWVGCAVFLVAAGVVLSPWLVRTAIWSGGNPVFPVAMSTLGHGHFSTGQMERFRLAHSPTATERPWATRLRITWTAVLGQWQYGYLLLPAAFGAAMLRRRDLAVRLLLIAGLVTFVVWIGFTHLLGRFLIQWVPIAGLLLARVRWGRAWPGGVLLALLAAGIGWTGVFPRLAFTTQDRTRSVLIGVSNLSFAVPSQLTDMLTAEKHVALVGDAGAFLYQIPSARLRYSTVFDLPAGEVDPIYAWAGPEVIGDPDWLLVINPAEIARLHSTYLATPPLPPQWNALGQPFVLRGADLAK